MSDDFDITLKHKLESNRDGADGGVSDVRAIVLITSGRAAPAMVDRRQGGLRDGEPEAGGQRFGGGTTQRAEPPNSCLLGVARPMRCSTKASIPHRLIKPRMFRHPSLAGRQGSKRGRPRSVRRHRCLRRAKTDNLRSRPTPTY
jgi:hypothetical protein